MKVRISGYAGGESTVNRLPWPMGVLRSGVAPRGLAVANGCGPGSHLTVTCVCVVAPQVDLWLVETQSSTIEAGVAIDALGRTQLPIGISYTPRDELGREGPAELRSGEAVDQAVALGIERGARAILFNCSQPEVMDAAVQAAVEVLPGSIDKAVRVGVYANAFTPEPCSDEPYAGVSDLRDDLTPARYLECAVRWARSGATIIGGCCAIGPEHISALRRRFG